MGRPLFDRFLRFRHIVTTGLGAHGDAALELLPPQPGQRVLDVGCGFGDTTQQIAALVGPRARRSASTPPRTSSRRRPPRPPRPASRTRASPSPTSRRRVRGALRPRLLAHGDDVLRQPGGGAAQRARGARPGRRARDGRVAPAEDNDWLYRAQKIVEGIVERPEEYDEPTCGPGPFSMADADTATDQLIARRLRGRLAAPLRPPDPGRQRHRRGDRPRDVDRARRARSCACSATARRTCMPRSTRRCARGLAEYQREDGGLGPASTWIVTATAPQSA